MTFFTLVTDSSGTTTTIEGRGSYSVTDAQEIRVAAREDQVETCRKGNDLLVNYEDGEAVRLIGFFKDDGTPVTDFYFQSPAVEGGFGRWLIGKDEEACHSFQLPIPGQANELLGQSSAPARAAAGILGAVGAVVGGSDAPGVGNSKRPVFGAGEVTGSVVEVADNAAGETTASLRAEGTIPFFGKEENETHEVVVALLSAEDSVHGTVTEHGTFTPALKADDEEQGSVGWTFEVDDSAVDYLAAGQTITQKYRITVSNSRNETATKDVTVTITGTNDAPTLSGHSTGQVSEQADGAAGENAALHTDTGTFSFADVDVIDIHKVTAAIASAQDSVNGAVAARGTFTSDITRDSTGSGSGTGEWSFSISDDEIDDLAEGQKLDQIYTITLEDGHGGAATRQVTVTITGKNDAPVALPVSATTNENGPAVVISADYSDVDTIDTHSFILQTNGTLGAVTDNGDGTFTYDPNGAFSALGAGDVGTDSFTYTVRDSSGAESSQTVTITITGENEAPVAPDVVLQESETFELGFDAADDFAGWTVDRSLDSGGMGEAIIERSGGNAVAVLSLFDTVTSGATAWGPKITSQTLVGRAGDRIELHYVLEGGEDPLKGDEAHAIGYILEAQTGRIIQTLFDDTVPLGGSSAQTVEVELAESGEFVFQFIVGSTDADGGKVMGGTLKIDYAMYETDLLAGNKEYAFEKAELLSGATDAEGDSLDITSVSANSEHGAAVTIGVDGRIYYDASTISGLAPGEEINDTFQFTVSDGNGGFTTATASVSVMGVSDGVNTANSAFTTTASIETDLIALLSGPDEIALFHDQDIPAIDHEADWTQLADPTMTGMHQEPNLEQTLIIA